MMEAEAEQNMHEWHKSRSFGESVGNAWRGLLHVFRTEKNMRIQVVLYLLALTAALLLQMSYLEFILIMMAAVLILVLEMINTAIEHLADIIEPRYHTSVRHLKDIMAGAVMMASLSALLIGVLLFGPHVIVLLAV